MVRLLELGRQRRRRVRDARGFGVKTVDVGGEGPREGGRHAIYVVGRDDGDQRPALVRLSGEVVRRVDVVGVGGGEGVEALLGGVVGDRLVPGKPFVVDRSHALVHLDPTIGEGGEWGKGRGGRRRVRVRVVVLRVLLRRWVVSAGLDHDTSVMENGRVEIKKEDGPVHRYVIAHRRRGRRS